ncbi:GyrI-like domain-containing protein [Microbacterium sp. NPDC055903]
MTAFAEKPYGPADRIDLHAEPLAVVRHERIRIADLSQVFDEGYTALGRCFASGALVPNGPAVAVYYGNPMDVFDLELGFAVVAAPSSPIEMDGVRINASALPVGPAVATTAIGAYDALGAAWSALVAKALGAGLSPRGISIEVYVSEPTDPPETLRTDLILPV